MATDARSAPKPGTPAEHIGRWIEQFRDRINLNAIDSHARKPVRLRVAGPRAGELIVVLDPDATPLSDVFESADAVTPTDQSTKAFLYVRSIDDPPVPDVLPAVGSALPVFIVEYQRPDVAAVPDSGIATTAPDHRPSVDHQGTYRLSALTVPEMRKHLLHDIVLACSGVEVALGAALPVGELSSKKLTE